MAFTNVPHPSQLSSPMQPTPLYPQLPRFRLRGKKMATLQISSNYSWLKLFVIGLLALSTAGISRPIEATAAPCHSLLTNGSLEETTNWQVKNNDGLSLFSHQVVRTGNQGAYLGGRHNATDRLSTTLVLPTGDSTLTLRFWWQLQSQETTTGNDQLLVLVSNQQANTHAELFALHGRDMTDQWQSVSIDLSDFAGQTLDLQFLSLTDAAQITDFFIDDIDLLACDAAAA